MFDELVAKNNNIDLYFRRSKAPHWIRVIIAKIRRRSLKRNIIKNTSMKGKRSRLLYSADIFYMLRYYNFIEMKSDYVKYLSINPKINGKQIESIIEYTYKDKTYNYGILVDVSRISVETIVTSSTKEEGFKWVYKYSAKEGGLDEVNYDGSTEELRTIIYALNNILYDIMRNIFMYNLTRSERIYDV